VECVRDTHPAAAARLDLESRWMPAPKPTQYDPFADEYEEHALNAPYNALYDRPATLELIGDVDGKRVFDVGCGPGIYVAELIDRGATVTGCDASARMIALAKARAGDAADLRVQSLEEPFGWLADASIDVVVAALVYHYINDRPAFLTEVQRVLTPDGVLVISTHHPAADWHRLGGSYFSVEAVTETWSKGWEITAWRMPLTQLTTEFAQAGFVIERVVEPTPQPDMAEKHPETYARLTTEPGFILFRLVKDPISR
jgi:SAM-dependent methyltransferase